MQGSFCGTRFARTVLETACALAAHSKSPLRESLAQAAMPFHAFGSAHSPLPHRERINVGGCLPTYLSQKWILVKFPRENGQPGNLPCKTCGDLQASVRQGWNSEISNVANEKPYSLKSSFLISFFCIPCKGSRTTIMPNNTIVTTAKRFQGTLMQIN